MWRLVGPVSFSIAEGPSTRTRRLLAEEERKVHRLPSTVPIHTLQVGTDAGQVYHSDGPATLRQLPDQAHVTDLTARSRRSPKRLTSMAKRTVYPC